MELFGLSGRVSIITGGNGGIGLGMAKGMACAGAAVVLAGRDEAKNAAAGSNLSSIRLASGTPFSTATSPARSSAAMPPIRR